MFDKMKALMDMQKKMQELKKELDNSVFEVSSQDNAVKVSMTGSQEVKQVTISADLGIIDKANLEKAIKDAYNKAIKHSQSIAAQKMKDISGFNIPGLT